METPRFLIAKYVPDVFRNEPRNIGVILWTPDAIVSRFLGEKPDAPGEIDEVAIPSFVASPEAYRQWVRYWRRETAKPAIRPATGGAAVPRSSPACLDALQQTGPSNFVLAAAGTIGEPVPPAGLPRLLTELFSDYILSPEVKFGPVSAFISPHYSDFDQFRNLPVESPSQSSVE